MMIDDGGFGAGEGLDFLEGFGMHGDNMTGLEEGQITGLDDLDKHATLDSIDITITSNKKSMDQIADVVENIGAAFVNPDEDDLSLQDQPMGNKYHLVFHYSHYYIFIKVYKINLYLYNVNVSILLELKFKMSTGLK